MSRKKSKNAKQKKAVQHHNQQPKKPIRNAHCFVLVPTFMTGQILNTKTPLRDALHKCEKLHMTGDAYISEHLRLILTALHDNAINLLQG